LPQVRLDPTGVPVDVLRPLAVFKRENELVSRRFGKLVALCSVNEDADESRGAIAIAVRLTNL
jgi:hypothetical protein